MNLRGVKMGTQVSNVFTVAKLFPLLILVGGGLFFIQVHGSPVPTVAESCPAGAWLSAVLLLIYAFTGLRGCTDSGRRSQESGS
jgi:APA family basic amino acid/polyamine antiporter